MNRNSIAGLKVVLVAPLAFSLLLAPALPARGFLEPGQASAAGQAPSSPLTYLPLAMRHMQGTQRVSLSSDGVQSNDYSYFPSVSGDGRYIAFGSSATNLVAGDTNGAPDVFVHDLQTGLTELVSVASDGTQGDGESNYPSISSDGRFVAFMSRAGNLVPGDTNSCWWPGGDTSCADVFVHDRQTGLTQRVSVASDGTQGNRGSSDPSISGDGRYVAFSSRADTLVEGDTHLCDPGPLSAQQENCSDVFVHDRQTGITRRVSVSSDGLQSNGHSAYYDKASISGDGRYVAFTSYATNLVEGGTQACGPFPEPRASIHDCPQVFVHDLQAGLTQLISVSNDGVQGDDASGNPSISADGRFVAFDSSASNLVVGATGGVFVHDHQTGLTELVSVSSTGVQATGAWPAISSDGRFVSFTSSADNLVEADTNDFQDVFLHDRQSGITEQVSVSSQELPADDHSYESAISADGRSIAFRSLASNLVPADTNQIDDVFVRWWSGWR